MHKLIGFYLVAVLSVISTFSMGHINWISNSITPPSPNGCNAYSTPPIFLANSSIDVEFMVTIKHTPTVDVYLIDGDTEFSLVQGLLEPSSNVITTQTITFPDIECLSCVLKIVQTDWPYKSCADIRLVKQLDSVEPESVFNVLSTQVDQNLHLTWENPIVDVGQILVLQSDTQITSVLENGIIYNVDDSIDGATVMYEGVDEMFDILSVDDGVNYYFQVFTQDEQYNYSSPAQYTVKTNETVEAVNHSPDVELIGNTIININSNDADDIILTAMVSDEDVDDTWTIIWSSTPNIVFTNEPENQFKATAQDNDFLIDQSYEITVTVTDSAEPPKTTIKNIIIETMDEPLDVGVITQTQTALDVDVQTQTALDVNTQTDLDLSNDTTVGRLNIVFLLGLFAILLSRSKWLFNHKVLAI